MPDSLLQGRMNRQSPSAAGLNAFMQNFTPGVSKMQQGMMQQKQMNAIAQALQKMRQQGQQQQQQQPMPGQMPGPSMSPMMNMGQNGMGMGQVQTQADRIRQLLGSGGPGGMGGGMGGMQNDPLGIFG